MTGTPAPYDLIVVGAGSGNAVADDRFADWRVAVVERGAFGGTCLNRGCIPSKMFVHPADLLVEAGREGPRLGARTTAAGADWPAIRDRVFGRIDPDAASAARSRAEDLDVYTGTATCTGPRTLAVTLEDGSRVEISGEQIVLATGSRPVVPPIEGLDPDDPAVHTSDTIMRLETFPRRIGILGGGYVGVEFAHVFAAYGAEVVQIDVAERLLAQQDADIADRFTEQARRRWEVRLQTALERVGHVDGRLALHLSDADDQRSVEEVDVLLVAIGRTPNSDLLDLDRAGVEVDDDGLVVVDEHQRTSAAGIWALGDASSHEPLKHVANQDARVVQHNLLHPDRLKVSDHRHVPHAVFSHPQVASVGLTEAEAREQGLDVAVAVKEYGDVAFGWALEDDHGPTAHAHMVKLLADRSTGLLVGAHLIGPEASVLVQPLIQAISFDQPVAGLARGQYWIHPALTEVVEGALIALEAEL